MNNQRIVMKGNITNNPEIKVSPKEQEYLNFGIAINDKTEETTTFYTVLVFSKLREVYKNLEKGDYVEVKGNLKLEVYTNSNNEPKLNAIVFANEVLSLNYIEKDNSINMNEEK